MLEIYAIKDTKVGEFQNPFYQRSKGEAIRSVTAAVNDNQQGNHFNKFYNDYELWKLGEFEPKTGIITNNIEHVVNCCDLKDNQGE